MHEGNDVSFLYFLDRAIVLMHFSCIYVVSDSVLEKWKWLNDGLGSFVSTLVLRAEGDYLIDRFLRYITRGIVLTEYKLLETRHIQHTNPTTF